MLRIQSKNLTTVHENDNFAILCERRLKSLPEAPYRLKKKKPVQWSNQFSEYILTPFFTVHENAYFAV